jgi:hypothetical protein
MFLTTWAVFTCLLLWIVSWWCLFVCDGNYNDSKAALEATGNKFDRDWHDFANEGNGPFSCWRNWAALPVFQHFKNTSVQIVPTLKIGDLSTMWTFNKGRRAFANWWRNLQFRESCSLWCLSPSLAFRKFTLHIQHFFECQKEAPICIKQPIFFLLIKIGNSLKICVGPAPSIRALKTLLN